MNQLYKHKRTGKLYRITNPEMPGKGDDGKWTSGLSYVGCYDGKARWTTWDRWNEAFEAAPGAEAQFEEE